jgi:hypothetical protein
MNNWYFIVDGDIHADETNGIMSLIGHKENSFAKFKRINNQYPIDFVLCIGDLTNDGYDGKGSCFGLFPKRKKNQLRAFQELYEKPLEMAGFKLYVTVGNHDLPSEHSLLHKGVMNYVAKKHNANASIFKAWESGCYSFIHKDIKFICLGVWPQRLQWLENELPSNTSDPCIIFYHYNMDGYFGTFWSDEDKLAFYNVIKNHNILAICNGHEHSSTVVDWNGIPTIRGSGDETAVIEINYFNGSPKLHINMI